LDPFLVLGAQRDGLYLLGLMLRAHPEISWLGDFDFALEWDEAEGSPWPPLAPYWLHLARSAEVEELGLRLDPLLDFPHLVRSLLEQQRDEGMASFGATIHGHYERALRLWPRARLLYLQQAVPRGEAEWTLQRRSDRSWRRIAAEIAPERRLELRYEDLLSDLAGEFDRVCQFLGVREETDLARTPVRLPSDRRAAPSLRFGSRARGARKRFARRLGERLAKLLGG
jgi:hypothetical protein